MSVFATAIIIIILIMEIIHDDNNDDGNNNDNDNSYHYFKSLGEASVLLGVRKLEQNQVSHSFMFWNKWMCWTLFVELYSLTAYQNVHKFECIVLAVYINLTAFRLIKTHVVYLLFS